MRFSCLLLATASLPGRSLLAVGLLAAPVAAQPAIGAEPPNEAAYPADADGDEALRMAPELPAETPADLRARLEQPTPVIAMADALLRTYWTNPALIAQRAATRAIDYRLPQARAAFGPKLSANASYGWQRDNVEVVTDIFIAQHGWASTAQAVLTQPLFTFGRSAAGERFALAQIDYQRHVLRSAEQQAMLDAITAYVDVLRDRAGVVIAQDNLALLEQELNDNRERLKAREVTSTDLQQVETRVELGRAQMLSAQRAVSGSEASFLRVVGAPAGQGAAPNPLQLPGRTLEDAYTFAELHNPVLFAAKAREQISRAQVSAARADMRLRVDLRGAGTYGTLTPYSNDLRQTSLRGEVVVSAPIYQGGQLSNRLAELQAANDGDWRLMDSAFRDNRAAVADAWAEWQAQAASVDRYAAAVASARKAYDGALTQERAGLRTTLDVLDLARELLTARTAANSASANVTIAKARLLFAMGSLDYGWLLPDETRYDANLHLVQVQNRNTLPLITPLLRAVDRLPLGSGDPRPVRDVAPSR